MSEEQDRDEKADTEADIVMLLYELAADGISSEGQREWRQNMAGRIQRFITDPERKKHEWVSVRIRQPEKPGNYLVYRIPRQYTEGVMAGRWAYSYAPITTRSWNGERWQSDQEVTHWQPLSNPPKELEEK